MADYAVRAATLGDLDALTDIYNHYVVNTAITFDLRTFAAAERRGWFDDHRNSGPHRLLVATDAHNMCLGYVAEDLMEILPAATLRLDPVRSLSYRFHSTERCPSG